MTLLLYKQLEKSMYRKGLLGEFMGIFTKLIIGFFAVMAAFFVAQAIASEKPNNNKPKIVKEKWHKPPKQKKVKVSFNPTSKPTTSQVYNIAAFEQKKWGGPSLINRIHCESTLQWHVTNGQYRGLLQFGPIWDSMWPGTPRKVTIVKKKVVKKPFVRYRKWSHIKKWIKKPQGYRKQTVWIIKIGHLPKNSDPYHGWAAIRVGQRAVSGHGPTTSWSCGL
jgi:hypothetical protein